MLEISSYINVATVVALLFCLGFQLLMIIFLTFALRAANRERAELHRQMFGVLKKIEGLTANKREQMLKHYDQMLEELSLRLPPTIAAQASQSIFEAESKILKRLAELENQPKHDQERQQKMDELLKTMEQLEHSLVTLTADTVQTVMTDSRKTLLSNESFIEKTLAA